MVSIEKMASVLRALPDPAFILSRSGKYVAVFGGSDARYYHDGNGLVGLNINDVVNSEKANWFLQQIKLALASGTLLIQEYELSNKDVKGLPEGGPEQPIWFEGRIQALDFMVDQEDVVLWVASNITQRHEQEIKLRELSDTDQLTRLFNRRKLETDLTLHYETFERHSVPLSILILDLDNLKQVNDTLGHHAGDKMILAVADICREQLRKTDIACRFGGDEFVIVLPNTNLQHAAQFADRLRECFNLALQHFSFDGAEVTVSIGVSTMLPTDRSYEDTLKRADNVLYKAKRNGKNQVVSA
ncbi:GGDEF domain-containing protein [Rheinheimera salexigens]|uniref:diguanylate cyclase n=1 Tax=Rheinheimera salexigens TaxID=1628148 RepID=A0A1E7Q302_9GAMM|nr:GGDEF domain-containing protein [Rheinheimera salexigens]OEY68519.1 deoxycytidine triphosphate deaminase [Rheinheimera salexigens]